MDLFVFKIVLAPVLIASATLAGRRWGPGVGGWFAALPLTSGPVSVIFLGQHGAVFAAHAATGTLAGLISVSVYSLAYCFLAPRYRWPICITTAVLAFLGATALLNMFTLSLSIVLALVLAALSGTLWLIPVPRTPLPFIQHPWWDLPARMVTAGAFVLGLTVAGDRLGPQLSGLLSPFPVFATILTVFAHSQRGSDASIQVLRGILTGLYAFAGFFVVVASVLTALPPLVTYGIAILVALCIQTFTLRFVRTGPGGRAADIVELESGL